MKNNNISEIRVYIKQKKYFEILKKPQLWFALFLFFFRALFLRLLIQKTRYYFISEAINNLCFNENQQQDIYSFRVINTLTPALQHYILNRKLDNNKFNVEQYLNEVLIRFESGVNAFCLFNNENIASVLFVSLNQELIKDINYYYKPKQNEAIIKDIYTLKDFRRKGLYYILMYHTTEYLKHMGYTFLTMWIMPHNKPTIHAQQKLGYKEAFLRVDAYTWLGLYRTITYNNKIALDDL